jgi:FkbM family methyltransferase
MSFISYAQNFEDVMIWRALKHVEKGFYIDVGANDPTLYSVTRAFYDKGWSGINLEPVAEFFERLKADRTRDTNLMIGAGESAGEFSFFDIPDTGLATSDKQVAQRHRDAGWTVNTISIQVLPLSKICQEYVQGEIHFLKIDVEGAEKDVLLGMDFKRWRPWLVIVEATIPSSQETAHQGWESILTESSYEFVYFDGLNRYYTAQEHAELKPAFSTPPNVFDGFVLNADQESKIRVAEAEAIAVRARQHSLNVEHKLAEANAHNKWVEAMLLAEKKRAEVAEFELCNEKNRVDAAEAWGVQLANQLNALYSSTSWKLTGPLRWLVSVFRLLLNRTNGRSSLRKLALNAALPVARWIITKPWLRAFVQKIRASSSFIDSHAARLTHHMVTQVAPSAIEALQEESLPDSTRRVLSRMQRATRTGHNTQ